MTYGYFTADISTDAAYARPTDLRKSALRAFTGENFPSAPVDAFPISAPPKIPKNSEPKPLSEGFSEENDRKNQAPMPNEDDMSECPTLSPFYRIRRAIQAQASASASA